MKLNKIFLAAIPAMMMLAACSNDEPTPGPVVEGDGYLAVKVNMPTEIKSRAANDNFDDGTPNEYEVKDGAILFFTGQNEANATFVGAYDLGNLEDVIDNDNDNITTSFLKTLKVENMTINGNLYGLVMLNYKNVITIQGPQNVIIGGQNFAGTFSQLMNMTSTANFYNGGDEYFFMTNTPKADKAGGITSPEGHNLTTLAVLTDGLHPTEAEAKAHPAGSIFVERAVAKATLELGENAKTLAIGGKTLKVKSVEWCLGNTESSSYIVRNMQNLDLNLLNPNTNSYRFIGAAAFGVTSIQPQVALYRPYWCVDPNYAADKEYTDQLGAAFPQANFKAQTAPLYCYENTFDVAHQNWMNTTRAILKVTYELPEGQEAFYTVNNNQDNLYDAASDAESFSMHFIVNDMTIKNALQAAMNGNQSINVADYVNVTFSRTNDGVHAVSAISFKDVTDEIGEGKIFKQQPTFSAEAEATLIANVNRYYVINEYKGGVSYYDVRFKHFGDDLTPWSLAADTQLTPTTNEAYPGLAADKYLGRYGMVRNNWYNVNISAIKKLGTPEVPNANVETPDDNIENEQWLSFTISLLSWAKRIQYNEL